MNSLNAIDRLTALFSKLPGVGKKSALRMTWQLLEKDRSYAAALAAEIGGLHDAIHRCPECGAFTESEPCPICADESRDSALICVVEKPQDVRIIEESREFRGRFHVLGGLIAPLEGVNPGDLSTAKLIARIRSGGVGEVILALNPTVEGDTTALYLQNLLKDLGVEVSRLATGMPVGGDLEYLDRLTLSRSLRGRVRLETVRD